MEEDSTLERPSVSGQLLDNFNYSKTLLSPWISYKFCKMTVFLVVNTGTIPCAHPRRLIEEIQLIIPSHGHTGTLTLTRQGKLLAITLSVEKAQQILRIQAHSCCYRSYSPSAVQLDSFCMTSPRMSHAKNLRRSTCDKDKTFLPRKVKLWCQLYRITLFHDRPRSWQNCQTYDHAIKSCRNEKDLPSRSNFKR